MQNANAQRLTRPCDTGRALHESYQGNEEKGGRRQKDEDQKKHKEKGRK